MLAEDMLADLGCTSVTAAASVEKALELIGRNDFDVAMLDMNLSGDRTHSVADSLTAKGIPFMFATGYSGRMQEGYDASPILIKPYRQQQLAALLLELLEPERLL
jgi:CheY-like chemotaxis protein